MWRARCLCWKLTATLERAVGRDVDVLELNTALRQNPALAWRAVSEGVMLFCRERRAFVDFRTQSMLRYLDTAFLRDMVARALDARLKAGRFGRQC